MIDRRDGDEIANPPPTKPRLSVVGGRTAPRIDREPTKRDRVWIRMDVNLDLTVTSACQQLARHPNVYARAGRLVEILDTGTLREVPLPTLRERLTEVANFFAAGKDKGLELKQPTERIVQAVASRGSWRADGMRDLDGLTRIPLLRPDGTVADAPGYDAATRHVFQPVAPIDPIPSTPTWEDARAALGALAAPVALFPFKKPGDRPVHLSAYLALILSGFVRHLLPTVPMFGISATTAGTGKTKLAKLPSVLLGDRVVEPTPYPDSEAEIGKTVGGFMRDGARLILLDNIRRPVDSDTLCVLATSENYAMRMLGRTEIAYLANQAIVILTGNNVVYVADVCRRMIPIELQTGDVDPSRRSHAFEPIEFAQAHRGTLISAALTVLRAWIVADRPQVDDLTLGSFEAWSRFVPQVLAWLGLPNPIEACASDATQDTQRGSSLALAYAWEDAERLAGRQGLTVHDVVRLAYPDVPKAPRALWSETERERIDHGQRLADRIEHALEETGRTAVAKKLPYALRGIRGRLLDDEQRRFEGRPDRTRMMHWSVLRGPVA